MCRLLTVRSQTPFAIGPHLEKFAHIVKTSREYQGHGWGCAYQDPAGLWQFYRNIKPVWEDDLSRFGETSLLVVHARSAFEDKDIVVEKVHHKSLYRWKPSLNVYVHSEHLCALSRQ